MSSITGTFNASGTNTQTLPDFWIFFVYCLVVVTVVVFFLFYFNRALANILSKIINFYAWNKYHAHIDIESIQFALLGGRILFKNVRYYSTNQSIFILKGHITMRYWLWHVRKEGESRDIKNPRRPCRILCNFQGVEWFMYNRTPAYYALQQVLGTAAARHEGGLGEGFDGIDSNAPLVNERTVTLDDPEQLANLGPENSLFRRLMPIQLDITTGAITIGNSDLECIMVIEFTQANGIYNTSQAPSQHDLYRTSLNLALREPKCNLRYNPDYTRPTQGRPLREQVPSETTHWYNPFSYLRTYLHRRDRTRARRANIARAQTWRGLERYRDELAEEADQATQNEYARVSQVLECSELTLTYYADVPGEVPRYQQPVEGVDIGNGGPAPEWGVHITARDGMLHYGPWADRQRGSMMKFFFPASHRNMKKTPCLKAGQTRVPTAIKIYIEFLSQTTVRVPLREASKNWKYARRSSNDDASELDDPMRPYGWIDLKASKDSWLKFVVPTVADDSGYSNTLLVELGGLDVVTSTNYASLLSAKRLKIEANMHNPLVWNSPRTWTFDFKFIRPQIYLLRDHLFLIQDLVKDWTAGSSTDLIHFVPTAYVLRITLDDFILNLCVNEHNIINNPTDVDDNAFIIIKGQKLKSTVTLPFLKFEPESNKISFDVNIENAKLEISLPVTHTLGAFLTEESSHCGSIVSFSLNGTYEFYSFLDPSHLESLTMFLKGSGATFKLFGFTVRYLLILRENYFGPFMNFSTLEEYRRRREHPEEARDIARRQAEAKAPSDPFEVFISLILEDGSLILPENLYDRANSSLIEFHELQLELRVLDVYLDLYVNSSPLTWTREGGAMVRKEKFKMKNMKDTQNYLYIDELNLYAHRLVGPRPRSATYVARWQFDVGTITGQVKPSFLLGIASFGKTFLYNMVDEDNALPSEFLTKLEPEVSFLQASVKEIDIALWGRQSATQVILKEGLNLEFDNLINEKYNSKVTLVLPQLTVKSLANTEQISTARDYYNSDPTEHPWVEVAHLDSSLNVTIYRSTANWQDARRAQQNYIRMQDKDTRRCPFLYDPDEVAMESRSQRSHKSHRSAYEHRHGMSYAPPLASKFADQRMSAIPHERVMPQFLDSAGDQEEDEEEHYGHGGSVAASSTHLVSDRKVSIVVGNTSLTRRSSESSKESQRSSTSTSTDSFKTASDGEDSEHGSVNSENDDNDDNDDNDENVSVYSNGEEAYVTLELEEDQRSDSDSGISADELSDQDGELFLPTSSGIPRPAAIPPSIPYRSYLKRYRVHRSRPINSNNAFFNAFVPPPRTFFSPAMANDSETQELEQDDEHLNSAFSKTVNSSFASLEQIDPNELPPKDKESADGNDLTVTIVLESAKAVSILLTPIFVKIVQEVTEAINAEDWDLETMLDTTQMNYMGQLTRYLTDKYTSTRFFVSVPKLHCHFIQDVMLPDDLTKANEDQTMIRTRYDLSDTVLCSADVILDQVVFFGSVKFQDMAFDQSGRTVAESSLKLLESRAHLDFNGLSCKVRFVSSSSLVGIFGIPVERQHQNAYVHSGNLATEPVVIDVTVDQFHCKWLGATRPNSLQLDVSKISAIIINESVEILVGAVTSWLTFVGDLKMILNDFSERRSHQLQAFIAAIATFAMEDNNTGTDPVFLTRPLNVLRLGARKFRNDVGWKLLAHMRHLLRFMPSQRAQTLQYRLTSGDAIKNIDSKKLFKFVIDTFSQWRNWEIGDISRARLFTQPFDQNERKPTDSSRGMVDKLIDFLVTSLNFGHIRIGEIDFSIYGEVGDNNSIALEKIGVDVQSQFRDDITMSNDNHRRSTDSDKLRQRILGYLDLTCCLNVGLINITSDPNLLAFTKHMLKVQRVFSAKLAALDNANRKVKDSITVSVAKPVAESSTQARETQRMSGLAGSAPAEDETIAATFDLKGLISRLDVLAQTLVMVERVNISANAEGLSMKSEVTGIQVSALYSNPQLTSLPLEKAEADNGSVMRNSHKGSRKSDKISNRLVVSAMGGVHSIKTSIEEMTYTLGGVVSYNLLLSFDLTGINTSAALSSMSRLRHKRLEPDREVLNFFLGIRGISIKLPQSLLRLYNFVEGWSAENKKSYDFLFKNLMDEWEEQRRSSTIPNADGPVLVFARAPASTPNREIKIQCLLKNLAFQSDLLPSLNLQYEVWDLFFMVQQSSANLLGPGLSYACQLTKQEVRFITKNKAERMRQEASEGQTGSFAIPVIRASGNIRALEPENKCIPVGSRRGSIVSASASATANTTSSKLNSYLSMDFVSLTLNVNMIDHLLTAQSLVGNEITEVFDLFSFAKRRKENSMPQTTSTLVPSPLVSLLYSLKISLRGLRVTVLSPVAIGFFESNILSGLITNAPIARNHHNLNPDKLAWKFSAHNFSLSLNHKAGDFQDQSEDANMRRYRLAYIVIDFAIQNYRASALDVSKGHNQEEARDPDGEVDSFFLDFPKIHAVMQPIALGKLTDLYIYYDTELKRRSQKKADEIDRLAANTRRILQSLDVEVPKVTERSRSLWEEKLLSLQISRFAAAIPLDSRDDVISLTTEEPNEVGALLVSVALISFVTRKLETSYAKLGEISAQFVTRFDQSKEEYFAPQNHPKMNRISLPSISCEVYAGPAEPKQPIWIDAKVDGFEVDVDGTLVNHLNTLNDIYRASLERVNAFTAETNFGSLFDESRAKTEIQNLSEHKEESPKVNFLNIEGSFIYRAGVCRLYPKSHVLRQGNRKSVPSGKSSKRASTPAVAPLITGRSSFASSAAIDESRRIDSSVAEIQIPGLNAWVTYQTPIGNAASPTTPIRAHAEVMIHSSENKLNPSLVPFLQEVVAGLKIGIQQSSEQKAVASANTAMRPIIGMNLSLYLRLSKSRLELSCQPISKVVCELNWEEGNFLMAVGSTDDSVQTMTCVGQIRGASGNVRHMFSPEACLRAELKDIGFNAMLMTRRTEMVKDDSISIAIDIPHISAELNIRHLQDLFLLQSVWLDQSIIDIMSGAYEPPRSLSTVSPATGTSVANGGKPNVDGEAGAKPNPFAKYVVVRLQRLYLSSDLGQAIGKVVFTTKNIVVDTRDIPGRTKSIRASTDIIDLKSEGRLVGTASMAGWFLDGRFARPLTNHVANQDLSLAKLTFQTSQILASLEYEYQKILVASIDPIKLTCSDIWSEPGLEAPSALIDVNMALDTIIVLGSVKTIPVFITMSNKLLALIEEKRALAGNYVRNRVQKTESSPVVTSPSLSTPAGSQTFVTPVEIAIKDWLIRPQAGIVLNLNTAKVTVFPNHFYDADCVQINAREMHIDLTRDMTNPVQEHRNLKAHFKSAALLKSVTKKMNRADERNMTINQWFDHASSSSSKNILGIPKTTLTMETWQTVGTNKIDHNFQMVFDGWVDIALNFGLIKYLQDLANLYAEQIKKGTPASASNEMAQSPTTNPPVLPPWDPKADPVDSAAVEASEKIISLPPAIDPSSSTTSTGSRELMFHPIEPVGLDPQLRIMGDATPPLEWVGVQRQKIPALVHTELTLNLEKVLLVLQQVYRSQLSDLMGVKSDRQ